MKNLHTKASLLLFLCASCEPNDIPPLPLIPAPAITAQILATALPIDNPKIKDFELSQYSTQFKIDDEFNRADNIKLAVKILNGTIIEPHQKFSFNESVGERTEVKGFKKATVLFMGMKRKGLGGGICQVSSTLYAAVMYGGLDIVQRTSHSRPSNYIKKGLDATVSFPELDLKFTNPFDVPIMIVAYVDAIEVDNKIKGKLLISIVGIESPFKKVRHLFVAGPSIPYTQKIIKAPYLKEPRIKQKGKDGVPGTSKWIYTGRDKSTKVIKKVSTYKPVIEVWYSKDNLIPTLDGGANLR